MPEWQICRIIYAPEGEDHERFMAQTEDIASRTSPTFMQRLVPPKSPRGKFVCWWEARLATTAGETAIAKSETFDHFDSDEIKRRAYSSLLGKLTGDGWEPFAADEHGQVQSLKRAKP